MGRRSDWDDELSKNTKQRRHNRKRRKLNADEEFMEGESSEFVRSLDNTKGTSWMAEKKYKRMFNEIEQGLSGVLGDGPFEWVDRRVFDAVFDRLTLLSLYKLMKNGVAIADFFRICYIQKYGGYWFDIDVEPAQIKIPDVGNIHLYDLGFKNISYMLFFVVHKKTQPTKGWVTIKLI